MSRRTFTATVTVTAEEAPAGYTSETFADDIRDAVFTAVTEDTPLDAIIVTVDPGEAK